MRRSTRTSLRRVAVVGVIFAGIFFITRYWLAPSMFSSLGLTTQTVPGTAQHYAETLEVSIQVLQNYHVNYNAIHSREVTLTNRGNSDFPAKNWEIYFTQIYIPELKELSGYTLQIKHVQGQVYKFCPLHSFRAIPPGGQYKFKYSSNGASLVYTDTFPNWYIIYKGSDPLVIESTRGDPAKFAKIQNTPLAWKSCSDKKQSCFDYHNPPTSADRFVRGSTQDLLSDPLPVIPSPMEVKSFNKEVKINMHLETWVITGDSVFRSEMEFLAGAWLLKISASEPLKHYIKFIEGEVPVSEEDDNMLSKEAYSLEVSPSEGTITITSSHPAGAFYAVQSLIALRDTEGKVPSIVIHDMPRFTYRGLMLDVARNFHSKQTIKRLIRLMAMYKLNKLHLHLSDDEGWRIEIPGLEELVSVGARRCHDESEHECLLPFLGSGPNSQNSGTGYFTVQDYQEILAYAVKHHIEVIPEIDVPGHAHAAVTAMKQRYRNTGSMKYLLNDPNDFSEYSSIQGFTDNAINPCINSTYDFLEKVITEIYKMHKGISPLSIFHFGGDEVPMSAWKKSRACQLLATSTGGINFQRYFLRRVSEIIHSLGLDIGAWEDGFKYEMASTLNPGLFPQKNVYAYSWKNPPHFRLLKSAYTMANMGYKVIMASATNLYLDHSQEPDPAERGLVWATRFIDTKRSFSYSPLRLYSSTNVDIMGRSVPECENDDYNCPSLANPESVQGIEAILFGELLTSTQILDYMLLPRLLAIAERAWHEAEWEDLPVGPQRKWMLQEDWMNFANTLGHRELPRLNNLGYQYRIPPPGAMLNPKDKSQMLVNVTYPGLTVEISRNGGWGWAKMLEDETKVEPGEKILLRCKAGTRYSRTILFDSRRRLVLND